MGRKNKSKKVVVENSPLPPVQDEVKDENSQDVKPVDSALLRENENLKKENKNLRQENENLKKECETLLEKLALLKENELLDQQSLKKEKPINQGQNISCITHENDMEIVDDNFNEDTYNKSLKNDEEIARNQLEGACANISETNWATSSNWLEDDEDFKSNIGSSKKPTWNSKNFIHPEMQGASGYDSMPQNECQQNPRNREVSHDSAYRDNQNEQGNHRHKRHQYSAFDDSSNRDQNEYRRNHGCKEYQHSAFNEKRNRGPTNNYGRREERKANFHDHNRIFYTPSNHCGNYNQRSKDTFSFNNYRGRDNRHSRNETKEKQESIRLKLQEVDGDLFTAPQDNALAHCVAADLRMGSGIAVQFKREFKEVNALLDQKKKVGEVAVLKNEGRFIYYLVTKKFSTGKPRIGDLQASLYEMRDHMEKNSVMKVAMPRIGCGLDRLHWKDVHQLLLEVFADLDVTITIYNFTIDNTTGTQKKSSLYVTDKIMKLVDIAKDTLLLLFGSESGHVDSTMEELDEKFRFINDYKKHSRSMGDVIILKKSGEILCILIVKKNPSDDISYSALTNCLGKVKKIFKEQEFFYMGLAAFVDNNDDLTVAKIITLFKTLFANLRGELWVCWPLELKNLYDEYFPQNG